MLKNEDMINVYNDYDSTIYAPSVDRRGLDLVFPKKDGDEPYYISIPFAEIKNLHRLDKNVFSKRILRFDEENEEEILKALNIRLEREKDSYSREEIENMILTPSDYVISQIVDIKDKGTIDRFLAQLVALKNTNKYFIPSKVEQYIRARKEEIEEGVRESVLKGQETENIPVIENDVDVAVINETPEKPKPKTTKKTTKK